MRRQQLWSIIFAAAIAVSTVQIPVLAADTTVSTEVAAEVEPGTSADTEVKTDSEETGESSEESSKEAVEAKTEDAAEVTAEEAVTDETATEEEKKFATSGWVNRSGDWYYRNANGSYRTGWQKIGGKWYYFDPDSYYMYSDGIYRINGSRYNFTKSGAMTTGWYQDPDYDSLWLYSNSSGVVQTGWKKIGGKWYYFDPDSYYMYSDGMYRINGSIYNFTKSGAMTTGWYRNPDGDDSWYYSNSSGVIQTGWKKIGGKWYYFDPDSYYMYSDGMYRINRSKYNFTKSGAMTTGWYEDPDYDFWYYSNSSGVLQTGWQKIGGKWYYFDPDGCYMLSDTYEYINGKEYEFDSSGACLNP